jgi:hypothetical protein
MYDSYQDVNNRTSEPDIPSSVRGTLNIQPQQAAIPPQLPFPNSSENKSQDRHKIDQKCYDMKQKLEWRIPKLKKEKIQDENEPQFIPHDFSASLSNFSGTFDVNAIPGLMPTSDINGQLNPNPYDLVPFKIPPTTRVTRSNNVIAPIDVRTVLGRGNDERRQKTDVRGPVDIRGPIDIRNMPADIYNNLIFGSDSQFDVRGIGRKKKVKSLAGLPAKLQELGVSKRLSKLERLIRMDESTMSEKDKSEKVRLMRLEKNRRAAAISRERKKRYIRSLEERTLIMSKHLEALELENSQLRQLLSQNNVQKPNTLHAALPHLPNLWLTAFDDEGSTKTEAPKKRSFSEMMDVNTQGQPEATEDPECTKHTIKMNDSPLAQTTVKNSELKRMRVESAGLESMDVW